MPPQNYLFFGYLINKAKGIITDSGNVAEEARSSASPCITLNTYAEHPETWRVGTNELVGEDPAALAQAMDTLMKGEWKKGELPERWDGRTAERIVQIVERDTGDAEERSFFGYIAGVRDDSFGFIDQISEEKANSPNAGTDEQPNESYKY